MDAAMDSSRVPTLGGRRCEESVRALCCSSPRFIDDAPLAPDLHREGVEVEDRVDTVERAGLPRPNSGLLLGDQAVLNRRDSG